MPANFFVISEREEDLTFCQSIAKRYGLSFHSATTAAEAKSFLLDHPQTLVFWDVDQMKTAPTIGHALIETISADRVVAVSDKPFNSSPHLFKVPAFNHYMFRRYDERAQEVYAKIGMACINPDSFGLFRYLPEDTPIQKIVLKQAAQRRAVIEAINNIFTKRGGNSRLVSMITRTSDELLMNAIFSAPTDSAGKRYRYALDRESDFKLTGKEEVTVELASTEKYIAVSIADQFGSLKRDVMLPILQRDYVKKSYKAPEGEGAGLGIYGIMQSGQSLLFVSKAGVRTEVILLFPVVATVVEFRNSFRFFSFILKS
jgi:hypothetical protein